MRTLAKSLCVRWPSVNARAGQILCVPTKSKYYSLIEIYDREQLQKKDKVFTIDFYTKKYKDNEVVLKELKNMELNFYNDAEYYASLNFLSENEKELLI